MQYMNLGKTGLKVSRICLGMMSYGTSEWRDWVLDEADSRPFVRRALELGIEIAFVNEPALEQAGSIGAVWRF